MRRLLAACLAGFAAFPSLAGVKPDLAGWGDLHWGMTRAAVQQALVGRVEALDPPLDYGAMQAKLRVRETRVGTVAFVALLQFDAADRLAQVAMERRDAGATPAAFRQAADALAAELGPPAQACERTQGQPKMNERRWRFASTSVHLSFLDFQGQAAEGDMNRDTLDPRIPSYEYRLSARRSFPRRLVLRYFPAANAELGEVPLCQLRR